MKNTFTLYLIPFFFVSCIIEPKVQNEKELIDLPNSEWKLLISKKGKFKILFPDLKLKEGTNTYQDEESQEFENHYYRLNIQDSISLNMTYDVTYTFRPNLNTKKEIEDMFDYQIDHLVSSLNANLDYIKILKDREYLGRELSMTVDSSDVKLTYRIYANNGILYSLNVLTDRNKGKLFNKSMSKFMDSFEIIGQ